MNSTEDIQAIAQALREEQVVLLPTETVWGLAARADSARAVAEIYALKDRSERKPLAVCVASLAQAERLGTFSNTARNLAKRYWPGSLTLVVPACSPSALQPETRDGDTIALRCPDISWRDVLWETPLALTSANVSGNAPALTEADARAAFPTLPALPSAPHTPSAPSTIARVIGQRVEILRQGDLHIDEVSA